MIAAAEICITAHNPAAYALAAPGASSISATRMRGRFWQKRPAKANRRAPLGTRRLLIFCQGALAERTHFELRAES